MQHNFVILFYSDFIECQRCEENYFEEYFQTYVKFLNKQKGGKKRRLPVLGSVRSV